MKTRKLLSLLAGVLMVFALLPSASAAQYDDTAGHWAAAAVDRWSGYGVIQGDGTSFHPNDNVTRAEIAVIFSKLFALTDTVGAQRFDDVSADAWYADAIAKVSAAGIMNGVGGNRADPNGTVTREMYFVMAARGLGIQPQNSTRGAQADGSAWAAGYINALTDRGYVKGDGQRVNALANLDRASAVALLDQMISTYAYQPGSRVEVSGSGVTLVVAQDVTLVGEGGDVILSGSGSLATASTPAPAATSSGSGGRRSSGGGSSPSYVYALMNIPYDKFYEAEGAVDAISSATKNGKARNINVNGASYHESAEAVTTEGIAGVMFPVRATASQLDALKALGAAEVTDASTPVSYEMNARGKISTVTLEGADILQESPDYSYYVLSETPASYLTLRVSGDAVSFGKAAGTPASGTVEGKVTAGGRHTEIEISLTGVEAERADISAVTVTADGETYALHHVVNIWGTEIGWNGSDLDLGGKTVTNVRFYLKNGTVTDYAASLAIPETGYVLMNIPYDKFYAAELGEDGTVDAVSGATLKYANKGIAGGSYHDVDAAADADVTALGVTYPVFVTDLSKLDDTLEVKATDKKTIHTVTGREKTITESEVEGKDILFCAPSYSWLALTEKPAYSKTLTVDDNSVFIFGAVGGRAAAVTVENPTLSYHTHHGCFVEIRLGTIEGVSDADAVNGVVVTFDDNSKTALPHVQGIWQKAQLGWPSADAVAGKTITNITFLTESGKYSCDVSIPVKLDFTGTLTASFTDASTLSLSGLPEDAANATVSVSSKVGRGETPVVLAENLTYAEALTLTTAATDGTTYTVTLSSDNYAPITAEAAYTESQPE